MISYQIGTAKVPVILCLCLFEAQHLSCKIYYYHHHPCRYSLMICSRHQSPYPFFHRNLMFLEITSSNSNSKCKSSEQHDQQFFSISNQITGPNINKTCLTIRTEAKTHALIQYFISCNNPPNIMF